MRPHQDCKEGRMAPRLCQRRIVYQNSTVCNHLKYDQKIQYLVLQTAGPTCADQAELKLVSIRGYQLGEALTFTIL